MEKKTNILKVIANFAVMILFMFSLGCTSQIDDENISESDLAIEQQEFVKIFTDLILNKQKGDTQGYTILFFPEDGEFITLTDDEYRLYASFATLLISGKEGDFALPSLAPNNGIPPAPEGEGWVYVGKGKGKTQALKMAYQMANKLPKNTDFEIHVKYEDDETFHVWYRLVDGRKEAPTN